MAVRIVIPSEELRLMARRLTELAIEEVEIAHAVGDLKERYGIYLPNTDRSWIEAEIESLAGRVENLAFFWEPDVAALLMAARIAEQEKDLVRGWTITLALVNVAYDLISKTKQRADALGVTKLAAIRSVNQKTLIAFAREYADELPVKALGRIAGFLAFALDTYLYWEESRQFDQALAKAAIPAGSGWAGGALAARGCGVATKHPLVVGGCFAVGAVIGGVVGQLGVDYYEKRFEEGATSHD